MKSRNYLKPLGTDTLETWWAMVKAENELCGGPIPPDAVILSYSGCGAGAQVTAAMLDKHMATYRKLAMLAKFLWDQPDDGYLVEREVYEVFGEPV